MIVKFRAMKREGYEPLNEFGSLLEAIHVFQEHCKTDNYDKAYFIERKEFPQEEV